MTPLVKPQISINGTDRNELLGQQLAVLEAFRALEHAMNEAAPNGRDYQHHPAELAPARKAWDERIDAVLALRTEIENHAIAISEAE